jgi:hypothetical protein
VASFYASCCFTVLLFSLSPFLVGSKVVTGVEPARAPASCCCTPPRQVSEMHWPSGRAMMDAALSWQPCTKLASCHKVPRVTASQLLLGEPAALHEHTAITLSWQPCTISPAAVASGAIATPRLSQRLRSGHTFFTCAGAVMTALLGGPAALHDRTAVASSWQALPSLPAAIECPVSQRHSCYWATLQPCMRGDQLHALLLSHSAAAPMKPVAWASP